MQRKLHLLVIVSFTAWASEGYAEPSLAEGATPFAQEGPVEYKLTLSHYSTQSLHANDVNLRAHLGNQTGWLGYYVEGPSGFDQLRGGYERTDRILSADVVTSLQAANHGFLGGSITATFGDPFFGVLGYGQTNLKPYANLNFDPNDAITIGLGWRKPDGPSVTLFLIRDDRVVPGEQNLHLLLRSPLPNQQRLTLDVFQKSGPANQDQSIQGVGTSITYDWPRFFLHLAYDPKVNFTPEYMTRISFGMRF